MLRVSLWRPNPIYGVHFSHSSSFVRLKTFYIRIVDPVTFRLTPVWINTDGSAPAITVVWVSDANNALAITGDVDAFRSTFGYSPDSGVVPVVVSPAHDCTTMASAADTGNFARRPLPSTPPLPAPDSAIL